MEKLGDTYSKGRADSDPARHHCTFSDSRFTGRHYSSEGSLTDLLSSYQDLYTVS